MPIACPRCQADGHFDALVRRRAASGYPLAIARSEASGCADMESHNACAAPASSAGLQLFRDAESLAEHPEASQAPKEQTPGGMEVASQECDVSEVSGCPGDEEVVPDVPVAPQCLFEQPPGSSQIGAVHGGHSEIQERGRLEPGCTDLTTTDPDGFFE
jgi:hypothetical protein